MGQIFIYATCFLIGLMAHRKGKNGILMAAIALVSIHSLSYLTTMIDPLFKFLIVKMNFDANDIHMTISCMVGGFFYSILNKTDNEK